jgi:hypothetical protein
MCTSSLSAGPAIQLSQGLSYIPPKANPQPSPPPAPQAAAAPPSDPNRGRNLNISA